MREKQRGTQELSVDFRMSCFVFQQCASAEFYLPRIFLVPIDEFGLLSGEL